MPPSGIWGSGPPSGAGCCAGSASGALLGHLPVGRLLRGDVDNGGADTPVRSDLVQNQAVVRLLPFACRKMQQRAGVAVREQCARADCCGVAQESSEAPSSSGGALQPLVMGATLSPNPLVVLVVTIGAGALFGMIGLTLAAR